MRSSDSRRLTVAVVAAAVLVVPAVIFFLAAIGRSLQPVAHEPARTLNAIVIWFEARSGAGVVALLVLLPAIGLILAAGLLWKSWSGDAGTRADVAGFVAAGARVLRHPAFVLSIVVLAFGIVYVIALTIHAIAG